MRTLWVQLDVPGLHVLAMEQADQPRFEPQISLIGCQQNLQQKKKKKEMTIGKNS